MLYLQLSEKDFSMGPWYILCNKVNPEQGYLIKLKELAERGVYSTNKITEEGYLIFDKETA